MKVTYRHLDQVLRAHGFTYRVVERARVYEHPHTGALIAIAYYPDAAEVLPAHLDSARIALKTYDLADPMDFVIELHEAKQADLAKTSTDAHRPAGHR
jgi:hypothetical protein